MLRRVLLPAPIITLQRLIFFKKNLYIKCHLPEGPIIAVSSLFRKIPLTSFNMIFGSKKKFFDFSY